MKSSSSLPWKKLYELVLACGNVRDPRAFTIQVLFRIKDICPFDQGLIFFVDGRGKIANHYLLDVDECWCNAYREIYVKDDPHFAQLKGLREVAGQPLVRVTNWQQEPPGHFVINYIVPMQLKFSLGFCFFDPNGLPCVIFALDRMKEHGTIFSEDEVSAVAAAVLQLNNLYKNLLFRPAEMQSVGGIDWDSTELTPREAEIAKLLCQGISPANISKSLFVSQSTTYKHIAHIYDKMHVSSRQQLLVKLLGN